jgi:hypothetical protein
MRKRPSEQVFKARAAAILSDGAEFDKLGRPEKVYVPGTGGQRYTIYLRWFGNKVETVCHCKGARSGGVCYHQMAAVLWALKRATVSFSKSKGNLKRLQRTGGWILEIMPEGMETVMYALVKDRNGWIEEQVDLPGELVEVAW